jgi:transcriptional regulator of acetoin/glycerol metabolism
VRFHSTPQSILNEEITKLALSVAQPLRWELALLPAGLNAARARGRKGGRPKSLSPKKVLMVQALYDKQDTIDDICRTLNISRATLYRYIKRS